jgi:hypothetical protein
VSDETDDAIKCDAIGEDCHGDVVYECSCQRCAREPPDERFHACKEHLIAAGEAHVRVRGRSASWRKVTP